MDITVGRKTEAVLNAVMQSGEFSTIEEFIASMASRWQSEHESLSRLPDRINIEELAAQHSVAPFSDSYQAPAGLWPEEESADEFIQFVREELHESSGH